MIPKRWVGALVLFMLFASACSLAKSDDDPSGIEAVQIDGIWVFKHQPDGFMDALHSGTPELVNGCLMVDDTVIVWHHDRMDDAAVAVETAKSGEQVQLLIAGGGISTHEGADPAMFPSVITDKCSTTAIWYGAP